MRDAEKMSGGTQRMRRERAYEDGEQDPKENLDLSELSAKQELGLSTSI